MKNREYVTRPLTGYVGVEQHIAAVMLAAQGLENAVVECEIQRQYGDCSAYMYVGGYRQLTKEEVKTKRAEEQAQKDEFEQREREQLARLQEKYGHDR